ncbi:uncharacterized protein LOC135709538 [Ochlerotatus camptorhynchus]|uniref:uncharacterized protein LOC135709538 n=1 Tax=Ochlerotatus camptorhynchus TaxID=644619 RepID=UPI0031CEC4F1
MAVQNLVEHMVVAEQQHHLSNPMLLYELVDRLPPNFKLEWANYKRTRIDVNLATFTEFMADLVAMASDVTMHVDPVHAACARQEKNTREKHQKEKIFIHHTGSSANQVSKGQETSPKDSAESSPVKTCTYCSQAGHRIMDCYSFKRLDVEGRWKAVREKGLCRICLVPHKSWPCRSKRECVYENCRLRHNSLLHCAAPSNNQPSSSKAQVNSSNIAHQNHHFLKACSLLRYLPITLYANGNEVNVFAFLDDGSTSTIMDAEIAERLGVEGPEAPLHLCWTGDVSRVEEKSQRIQLIVSGTTKNQRYSLSNVRTVKHLKLPSQTLNYEDICNVHPYLKHLPITSYSDVRPRLIIGVDNVKLISALKIREGGNGGLIAAKTRLGWSIYGRHSEPEGREQLHFHTVQEKQVPDNAMLYDLMKQFFNIEESCITLKPESEDNKRANQILENTTIRVPTGFEVGLLWKEDEHNLPDTYPLALRRLKCLEKRLLRNPDLYVKVKELVQSYISKGYAHRASKTELDSVHQRHTWYLPLGVVQNPKKPNKVRLIWDAAATVEGLCFNDLLLKGPDLLVSLIAVLIRFRERNIAIGGDLREMFHQIIIRAADRQFLRFLWRDNPEDPPQVYVMDVAIFGASCSPCIAQFVKNRNAEEFSEEFPRAAKAITNNHYVDDYLDSVDTVDEAIELMKQVKYIHASGGFEICQFVSNSREVLHNLGVLQEVSNKNLNLDSESERVLGMFWIPGSDIFTFTSPSNSELSSLDSRLSIPTKRQVLRIIMSIFDPLGLIAHFIIHGKVLMQHIWRAGTNWDELIPEHLQHTWRAWQEYLTHLGEIQIPRCLLGCTRSDQSRVSELHAFVDASRQAYAGAIYLRTVGECGVECSLIIAKSKVAPLKPVSIPRLELQAALIGARLMENVCQHLTLPTTRRVFWSDSSTVLSWLNSDAVRYHQYVAFRIGEILSTSKVDEWRYVPSGQNVADDATKWKAGPDFSKESLWFNGPKFLRLPETEWPVHRKPQDTAEEQVRQLFHHQEVVHDPVVDVSRFSNWLRLHRTVAYVCKAARLFKERAGNYKIRRELSSEEFAEAENLLWRQAQEEAFSLEYLLLKTKGDGENEPMVEKSSPLYKLSPFMDQLGVIRMGSRIGAAPFAPYEAKYPIILPKKHPITFLLTDSYHQRLLHANNETVFNDMRQRFYIPALRRLVRKVAAECQRCKNSKAIPRIPRMAPLPRARLTPFVKPFSYVGIDYFGPMLVKVGRSQVKRWVALFTCLTIRAVHMEVVHTLSAQSCIMAFRRFVARRGAPLEVYSDNGTCFVGANRQLKMEMKKINENCASTFTNARTKWIFNPPAAPHMGGLWERMVRSVKTAMFAIGNGLRQPNEETFETIVLEAESVVNSRPLTYIALDSADQEALTPNHFLLYGTQGVNQPAVQPIDHRSALRDSWKLAQWKIDEFWRRWTREYLPVVARRSKWFEPVKPLQVGDIVIVVDDTARNHWIRGRITEVCVAQDGQVRKARILTAKGIILRPSAKIAVLDVFGSPGPHGSGNVATTTGSSPGDCATGRSLDLVE